MFEKLLHCGSAGWTQLPQVSVSVQLQHALGELTLCLMFVQFRGGQKMRDY